MTAEDGAFACGVNDDERLIAGAAGRGEEMRFDARAFERSTMDFRGVVVTEFADVMRSKTPGSAGDHSACDFSPGEDGSGFEFDFGTARRKFGERD
jgi:hypothetical protein